MFIYLFAHLFVFGQCSLSNSVKRFLFAGFALLCSLGAMRPLDCVKKLSALSSSKIQ